MTLQVELKLIVKDPVASQTKEISPDEVFVSTGEDVYLDGPITPRVALLDFDEKTGMLTRPIPFRPPANADAKGSYGFSDATETGQTLPREYVSVSVFGTVLKTMKMFEEPDALGRRIVWAFEAPQLLVVPRAGELANAFYQRESHSLQFFFYTPGNGPRIYTSHSQDIVSHETGHAILDGIAPDLYNSFSPQSLAIHEAVADLTALLSAFRCRELSEQVLRDTGGSLRVPTAFTGIAEQFAEGLKENRHYLRNLFNSKSLAKDAKPEDRVDPSEPHSLSEVLSGALYTVMVALHESLKDSFAASPTASTNLVEAQESEYAQVKQGMRDAPRETPGYFALDAASQDAARQKVAMKALFVAAERFKRTLFRGLDYLPPGDATFANLARAILAADQASHPDSDDQRKWIVDEFVRRGVVADASELEVRTNFAHDAVGGLDLESLVESDWAAYQFANANREFLHIPKDVPFEVRPRLDVTKLYWHRDGKKVVRELLFKILWDQVEPNPVGGGLPPQRRIRVGTTLAIDWETRTIRTLLNSNDTLAQKPERDRLLASLVGSEVLRMGDEAAAADGSPLHGVVRGDVIQGVLRIRGGARMLHVTPAGAR